MAEPEAILMAVRDHLRNAEQHVHTRDFANAYKSAEAAIQVARDQKHPASLAAAYYGMAAVIWSGGGTSEDAHHYASLAAQHTKANTETDLLVRTLVARLKVARGNYEAAIVLNEDLLKYYEEDADLRGRADVLRSLGDVHVAKGEFERARERYLSSLGIYAKLNDPLNHAGLFLSMGSLAYQTGRVDEARTYWEQARAIAEANGYRHIVETADEGLRMIP